MEFKINKIDLELRQIINEETKEGKIHGKRAISINKEKDHKNNKEYGNGKNRVVQYKEDGQKLAIEAVKVENVQVEGFKEEMESENPVYRGTFLDIRK